MSKQRGAISGTLVTLIVVIGFFLLIGGIGFMSYVGAYNYGNKMENQLVAVQTDNKNILAQYGQKVQEAARVPAMYRDDLNKVIATDIQGRYGPNGSQATFQWLKEHNISLDNQLYRQVQQIVESGRDNFENGQRRQIDVLRQYKTHLGTFWGGMWLKFAGYPREDLSKFDIVSTGRADEAFKNHREDRPIQF